jgi:hypothetical protein
LWSPRWGRRASVGAAHPRGRRGGEGGHRWAPLVVVVTEVGKEGVGGRPLWSWSPRWGRRVSVGAARGRPRRRRGRSCAPPTASASPCRHRPPPPRQAQRPPCRRLPRRLSPHQNQRKERRERTEWEERKERGPNERIRRDRTRTVRYFSASPARPSVSIFWPRAAPGLWFQLFKTAVTKNRLLFLVSAVLSNRHEK